MAIPKLSPEQLQAARKAATESRRKRAEFKEKVRSGKFSFSKALDAALADEVLAHIKVVDLLKAIPRVGEKRAAEIMEQYRIAENRRIRGLGRKQIAGLRAEF